MSLYFAYYSGVGTSLIIIYWFHFGSWELLNSIYARAAKLLIILLNLSRDTIIIRFEMVSSSFDLGI